MPRTSSQAVKGILMRDYDKVNNPSLTPFIETANSVTSRVNNLASSNGYSLTDTELELIERCLSAHLYVMSDQTYAEKRTGDAEAVYKGMSGMGLEASNYGQQALIIDTTGSLAALSKGYKAKGFWLGLNPTSQTDYYLRR